MIDVTIADLIMRVNDERGLFIVNKAMMDSDFIDDYFSVIINLGLEYCCKRLIKSLETIYDDIEKEERTKKWHDQHICNSLNLVPRPIPLGVNLVY